MPSIPETAEPILVPAATDGEADGFELRFEHSPFRIVERPLRQVKKLPKLEPGLWSGELTEVQSLIGAIENQNQEEIAAIVERIVRDGSIKIGDTYASVEELKQPEMLTRYIGAALSTAMQTLKGGARLVLWFDRHDNRLRTGLLCPNERAAAFAMLVHNKNLKTARCPRCNKLFKVDAWHPRTYCGDRCKNATNFADFYARQRKAKRAKATRKARVGRAARHQG